MAQQNRKRGGGQKRGGGPRGTNNNSANSSGAGPSGTNTPQPSNLTNGLANQSASRQPPTPAPVHQSLPVGVTSTAFQGDTKSNSYQADSQKPTGSKRGGRNYRAPAPKPPVDAPQAQSASFKPLATDKQSSSQNTGTRSQNAPIAFINATRPKSTENIPPARQGGAYASTVGRLSSDDIRGSKCCEHKLTPVAATPTTIMTETYSAATAPKTSALPVPVVVGLPPTMQSTASRPALPPYLPGLIEPTTDEEIAERELHVHFMEQALKMGELALNTNETPVGCVLVYRGRVIAKGMNATNVTRNGTRHAEFMALSALLSQKEPGDIKDVVNDPALDDASWGDVDPTDGHIFPYGQKLHPAPIVDRSIISECILYVTVEPCVMCASLLRQLGVKKVYFGAVNDKFGGTGGVFKINLNSKSIPRPGDRPYQNGYGPQDPNRIIKGRIGPPQRDEEDGDGGNVEPGYPVEGGYLRDDAVSLLRRFYVQENGRAPQPRKKEGRAARLFAMENQAKNGSASEFSDTGTPPNAAVDGEMPVDVDMMPMDIETPVGANTPADDGGSVKAANGASST
ncbi:hypothetical protein M426DRAFT_8716 [Hypoxylon sp. CI-4A]|nr:hypothetical protein M426DRAFT_8716 [Hypoxylon sp. CI-4A]